MCILRDAYKCIPKLIPTMFVPCLTYTILLVCEDYSTLS